MRRRAAVEICFWLAVGLLVYTQLGYALVLVALDRVLRRRAIVATTRGALPSVSLIVAAHDEGGVIAARIANARALDYPPELLELVVSCDGCTDATAQLARDAGADVVLERPRAGKVRAQDAAVDGSGGEIVAFSDANASWEPDALRQLVAPFADPRVGYACRQGRFLRAADGSNQ